MGSNIGDSRSAMERAVAALSCISERPLRRSSYFESDPWGFDSPNRFTNLGVDIFNSLQPLDILTQLRRIEHEISPASHRNPDGTYRDRLLDLDLIFALHLPFNPHPSSPDPHLTSDSLRPSAHSPIPDPQVPISESQLLSPESQVQISEPQFQLSESYLPISELQFQLSESEFIRMDTPDLTLPHPRAHLRDFVLTPLLELHPAFPLSLLTTSIG